MTTVISIIICVISLAAFIPGVIYLTHMFQQNSYKPKVQAKWIRKNAVKCLPFVSAAQLRKKAKKPLVYTARVKRLLSTTYALELIAVAAAIISAAKADNVWISLIPAAIAVLAPYFLLFTNLLNRPLENAVKQWYINDAVKQLNACRSHLQVIGVTGSFGKTSVKYFLGTLLKAKYNVLITPESYNTPMGVVKTIREQLKATHEVFVCEMGARNVGDIKELCDLVNPDSGVITAIGEQHLESFGSQQNITNTKFELERELPASGTIFLNGDNEHIRKQPLTPGRRAVYYGFDESNTYRAIDITMDERGSSFTVAGPGETGRFSTKLLGMSSVQNITGAVAVAHQMGIPMSDIAAQVRRLEPVPHRLQLIRRGDVAIIDDAYNANPAGAKAALETLGCMKGCRIVVTPGYVELGARQYDLNFELGAEAAKHCDYICVVARATESERKLSEAIVEGAKSGGFDPSKVFLFDNLNEALNKAYTVPAEGSRLILLENDLPDNF